MENGRVFEIINQVIQQAFHNEFGNASPPPHIDSIESLNAIGAWGG